MLSTLEAAYLDEIIDFTESQECTPLAGILDNPRCWEIAKKYKKTREQVVRDVGDILSDIFYYLPEKQGDL